LLLNCSFELILSCMSVPLHRSRHPFAFVADARVVRSVAVAGDADQ